MSKGLAIYIKNTDLSSIKICHAKRHDSFYMLSKGGDLNGTRTSISKDSGTRTDNKRDE